MASLTIDSANNIYTSSNSSFSKYSSTFTYISQWGGSGFGDGQFLVTRGIGVDGAGNIYVSDRFNSRIQKFNSDGNFVLKFGSQGSGDGQLSNADDLAVDSDGNIYVADAGNNRI
jgi:tripartite motif-containing protein 71